MGTLSGAVTHFHICFLPREEFTLKEKNLLLLEQILSFRSKHCFGRAMSANLKEANRKSQKLFPVVKNGG